MKTILIRRSGNNFQWKEPATTSTYWHYLPANVTTAAQMKQYFFEGKQSNQAWQSWQNVEFKYVDINGETYQHYKVKQNGNLHTATVNFDDGKRMTVTADELWTAADRLNYLRENAVRLPKDIDNVDDALKYLATEEPFTVNDYNTRLQKKIKDGMIARCEQHAAPVNAVVEFAD